MTYYVKFGVPERKFTITCRFQAIEDIKTYAEEFGYEVLDVRNKPFNNTKSKRDGFAPHYNHGLGQWVETRRQFNEEVKRRGLVEVGNERVDFSKTQGKTQKYFDDQVVRTMNEMGAGLSDGEAKELIDNGG